MKKSVFIIGMILTTGLFTSCGNQREMTTKTLEIAPGASIVDDVRLPNKESVEVGKTYYISALILNIRSQDDRDAYHVKGYLSRNDKVNYRKLLK